MGGDNGLIYPIQTSRANSQEPKDEAEGHIDSRKSGSISFAKDVNAPRSSSSALYIPPPRERDQGMHTSIARGAYPEARIDRT